MGRHAKAKERKPLSSKTKQWLRALVPLIQDRPLDKLAIDDLAKLGGKSKSNIYSYFSSKEEIYQTALQLIIDDLQAVVSDEILEGDEMEQAYRQIMVTISEGIEGLSIYFLDQIQSFFPSVWAIVEQFTSQLLANLALVYQKGMDTGEFRSSNVALLTALDNHFVMSIMTDSAYFQDQELSLNDLVTEYLEMRIRALK